MKPQQPLLLVFAVCVFYLSAFAGQTQNPARVISYGYAAVSDEKTLSQIHQEALRDALKNALVQAHSELDIQTCIEGMHLKKQTIQSHSRGYIEQSDILEAGILTTDPSIYRIRLSVLILPLQTTPHPQK